MLKVLHCGDEDLQLKATARFAVIYKNTFGADALADIVGMAERQIDIVVIMQLAWAMAYNADEGIKDFETFVDEKNVDWLNIADKVLTIAQKSLSSKVKSKKKPPHPARKR